MRFQARLFKRAAAVALFICLPAEARDAVTAKSFMVSAAHPLAAEAGYQVLKRGGSAVDAAVAVQMALGLAEPQASGIGGGAFVLYWDEKAKVLYTYDGRETAPAKARRDRFLKPDGTPMALREAIPGGRSVGTPGVLRALELAHRKHGKLPWTTLFEPAIAMAEAGFPMTERLYGWLERIEGFREDASARALFYTEDGKPKPVGSPVVNADYAATLRLLAKGGADAFYRGPIAADIVRAVRSHPVAGDLSEEDLAAYQAFEREPVCGPYREVRVCSMGPPSSGGIAVLQILGVLERTPFAQSPPESESALHFFAEARRLAFADRAKYLGDPDFVTVPVSGLLKKSYLDRRAALVGNKAMPLPQAGDTEAPGTSHVSIVDAEGNVVSMTTTIEAAFGSRIMVRGFVLNNELTDFDFVPGSANEVAPRKRPRSSMAPAIVFEAGGPVRIVIGSAGGPYIIGDVAKALIGMLDWKLDVQSAIELPNFGGRGDAIEIEAGPAYEGLAAAERARGHEVRPREFPSGLHGIERFDQGWRGGADPRREGAVRGD
jgi:gamma-glutamyltranspeptidase/glutathione hydrolase